MNNLRSSKGKRMFKGKVLLAIALSLSAIDVSTAFAADGIQEVQTDASNAQKQALQNQSSTPAPSVSATPNTKGKNGVQQVSPNTNYQRARDWRPKTVQTCVKGGISLQLKKSMTCPKGFVKK